MRKPPLASPENINHSNKPQVAQETKSSVYAESVRITPERLIKALKNVYRQGGTNEH